MAPHADEQPRSVVAELVRLLLDPHPGRLEYATRVALICALTALVVEIYQTPGPALTVYVVFFLNKPDRAGSLIQNAVFLILISLIVGLTVLLTMAVIDTPLWRLAVMALISCGMLFLASASKLRPIGGIIALIVAYALDLLGTVHAGEIATRALLYAWLFVGIPAAASMGVNLLFAPPPRKLAERAIAERLRLAAAMLRGPDERNRRAFTASLREGASEIHEWLKLAALEKNSPAQDIAALRHAAQSTAGILSAVEFADRFADETLSDSRRERLAQSLEQMAAILSRGGYPIELALDDPTPQARMSALSARTWANMRELLVRFAEPSPSESRVPQDPPPQPTQRHAGFLLPDAFTNPEHLRYALKTTAAAMFCYVLYSLLDWPGIHTSFITCYIVSLGTAAETVEKLTLRIAGCLIGAAGGIAAIVFLMPSLTSIESLLGVTFLGAWVSAWVASGSPRISYAGFQIAFAFFLCVIQGPSPSFDLETARDRIIGILIGNLVVYVLFTQVWPVSVGKRIDPALSALLRRLSAMTRTTSLATRGSVAAEAQEALGAIERDLDLANYEPAAIRPAEGWLAARRRAAAEIAALEGPLWLIQDEDRVFADEVAQQLDALSYSLSALEERARSPPETQDVSAEESGTGPTTSGASQGGPLTDSIGSHLRRLHAALVQSTNERAASHAAS